MANWSDPRIGASQPTTTVGRDVAFDAGLRAHMLSVYNYMTSGVLLTGIVALLFARSGAVMSLFSFDTGGASTLGCRHARAARHRDVAELRHQPHLDRHRADPVLGLCGADGRCRCRRSSSSTPAARSRTTFFATAAALRQPQPVGLYDEEGPVGRSGTFLIMGLFGLIVAMVINLFLQSDTFDLAISAIGVLIFAGLTAYDTQKIKSIYFAVAGTEFHGKAVDHGRADALSRLHQHVPLPAALHGQPELGSAQASKGRARRRRRAFSFCAQRRWRRKKASVSAQAASAASRL